MLAIYIAYNLKRLGADDFICNSCSTDGGQCYIVYPRFMSADACDEVISWLNFEAERVKKIKLKQLNKFTDIPAPTEDAASSEELFKELGASEEAAKKMQVEIERASGNVPKDVS